MWRRQKIVASIDHAGVGPQQKARFVLPSLLRWLLDRNETDLLDYFLTFWADGEVDKLLHHSSWLAIGIEEGGSSVRITFCQNTFLGGRSSINWNYPDSAGFSISQTHVTYTIWIFADFLRDLLVAGE